MATAQNEALAQRESSQLTATPWTYGRARLPPTLPVGVLPMLPTSLSIAGKTTRTIAHDAQPALCGMACPRFDGIGASAHGGTMQCGATGASRCQRLCANAGSGRCSLRAAGRATPIVTDPVRGRGSCSTNPQSGIGSACHDRGEMAKAASVAAVNRDSCTRKSAGQQRSLGEDCWRCSQVWRPSDDWTTGSGTRHVSIWRRNLAAT